MTGLQTHSKSKFQRRDYIHAIATSVPTHRVVTVWQGESEPDVEPVVAIEHQVKTTFATHDKLQGTPATPEEFKANGWHVSFHGTEQYPVINRDNELCTVLPDEMAGWISLHIVNEEPTATGLDLIGS